MKNLLILILLNFSVTINAQFAIIQDKDGYVNVRAHPNINSDILAKIKNNTIITITSEENEGLENTNWILGRFDAKNERFGFIYKDRVKKLENFKSIKPELKTVNSILFYTGDYRISIETQKFNSKDHAINSKSNFIDIIDGQKIIGTDGTLPQTEFKSFKIYYKEKEIEIPKNFYSNLYNVDVQYFQLTHNKELNQYYLFGSFSDGAGSFNALWVLKDGKIIKHIAEISLYA